MKDARASSWVTGLLFAFCGAWSLWVRLSLTRKTKVETQKKETSKEPQKKRSWWKENMQREIYFPKKSS